MRRLNWTIAVACIFAGLILWLHLSSVMAMVLSTALILLGVLLYHLWIVASIRKPQPTPTFKPRFEDGYKYALKTHYDRARYRSANHR